MKNRFGSKIGVWGLSIGFLFLLGTAVLSLVGVPFRTLSSAQPTVEPFNEDVRNTKHNLSANPVPNPSLFQHLFDPDLERNIKSTAGPNGTSEVCVFCHTPHGASQEGVQIRAPIWNRNLSPAHYQMYDQVWSKSFEAKPNNPGRPTGYSRLCLSCHDGTISLGSVINKAGSGGLNGAPYEMEYPTGQSPAGPPGSMPVGAGVNAQATRVLGRDLRNDHPISMTFDTELLSKDSEFVNPGPPIRRPLTQSTPTPIAPLRRATGNSTEIFDSVQCTSCHNPHQVDFPKFLRANRLQSTTFATTQAEKHPGLPSTEAPPKGGGAIICLFCHDKPGWPYNPADLNTHFGDRQAGIFDDVRLKPGATDLHIGESPMVAERACLACHDPHTRQGAVRIMREGVDKFGNVAIEQTCYQCHQPQETSILQAPTRAPDIMTQFFKDREGNGNHGTSPTGSAMDLTLALGHQPVFIDLPKEGVQLGSDNRMPSFFGGPFTEPANNKIATEHAPPTPDTAHVECVDCHNMHRVTRRNRFQGMPGVTIKGGIVAKTLKSVDERREPYIYEVCLRCHGNTFNNHVRESLFTAAGTGKMVQARGNSPINAAVGVNANGSNKRKEFDPSSVPFYPDNFRIQNPATPSGPLLPDPNPPRFNHSFHPVFQPARNQSGVLNNYTNNMSVPTQQGQLLGRMGLSRERTIHCTDCHNTDLFGTYLGGVPNLISFVLPGGFPTMQSCWDGSQNTNCPDYPGPITSDDTRGTAYRRPTDVLPDIPVNPEGTRTASLNDPKTPQGPHGSIYKRILRANYDTKIGTADQALIGDSLCTNCTGNAKATYNSRNFALCFNCHAEAAFTTPYWESPSARAPKERLTNFYRGGTAKVDGTNPGGNLHMLHLVGRTNARCHECHNNVHSNVEAGNTVYVGLNSSQFVSDNPGHNTDTHLLNFQPNIRGNRIADQPMWGAGFMVNGPGSSTGDDWSGPNGHRGPGCNLRCHGFRMVHNYDAHSVVNGQK